MDSGTLDGEVGTFHHPVGLRGAWLCKSVFGLLSAGLVKKTDLVSGGTGLALEEVVGELFPVVGEDGPDFEREEISATGEEVGCILRRLPVIDQIEHNSCSP